MRLAQSIRVIVTTVMLLVISNQVAAQTTYTPTQYKAKLYKVEMSTDGTDWVAVLSSDSGTLIDLADSNSFSNAFGADTAIPVGDYKHIRMVLGTTLTWSYPTAPVSLTDQDVLVTGPPGPAAGQMTVYFATYDKSGKPNGYGGSGTETAPFLLGASPNILAGVETTLRIVFVVTDTLVDQGSSYDLAPPQMFFVSENGSAASLAGTYNTVLYNSIKAKSGSSITKWKSQSGTGTLTFDGSGSWVWSGKMNDFDLYNSATGSIVASATASGRYGINSDGSFWMIATGEPGTMRGAVSSDNKMIVSTMYDSATSHMMFFGVAQASSVSVSTMNSNYYFTTYGSRYDSGSTSLSYEGSFGVVAANGSGGVSGTQDSNSLSVTNPTSSSPTVGSPVSNLAFSFSDTLSIQSNGTMSNATGDLGGGILQSGDAACIAFDFNSTYNPTNQFGFLVRQSDANTFSVASLNGTYFGGHFGDMNEGSGTSVYFSGFFRIVFDGKGAATVILLENQEGTLEVNSFAMTYTVDASAGTVSFVQSGQESMIRGAIGPGAMSFILSARAETNSAANDQRFLGLGLKQ